MKSSSLHKFWSKPKVLFYEFVLVTKPQSDKRLKMAVALLYSPSSQLSLSSPKPRTFSFNPSLFPSPISRSHSSGHFKTAQPLRFRPKTRSIAPVVEGISRELGEIYQSCNFWNWRGFNVSYLVKGNGPPLLLVHGFGASIAHWRRLG